MNFKIDLQREASRKNAAYWHVGAGWVSNLIIMTQGLILLPLYLKFLGDRLYGFWLASGGILAWISMVDIGGASVTRLRCAASFAKKDLQAVVNYFWHGFVVTLPILLVFCGLVVTLAWLVPSWLKIDSEFYFIIRGCFLVVGLAGAMNLFNLFLTEFASALQRPAVPVLAQACSDLLGLGIVIFGLVGGWGLWALALGAVGRSVLAIIITVVYIYHLLHATGMRNCWSRKIFWDYFTTTPAVFAAKASGNFAANLPLFLLTRLIGPESVIVYTVSMRLIQTMELFINRGIHSLYAATGHFFNDPTVTPEHKNKVVRGLVTGFSSSATACFVLYATINQSFIYLWTSGNYFAGQKFTSLMALATYIVLANQILEAFTGSVASLKLMAIIGTVERLCRVVLLLVCVPWLGILGVPLVLLGTQATLPMVYLWMIRKHQPVVALAANSLIFLWIPLSICLPLASLFAPFLITESWLMLIAYSSAIFVVLALIILLVYPEIRQQTMQIAAKSRYIVRRIARSDK